MESPTDDARVDGAESLSVCPPSVPPEGTRPVLVRAVVAPADCLDVAASLDYITYAIITSSVATRFARSLRSFVAACKAERRALPPPPSPHTHNGVPSKP